MSTDARAETGHYEDEQGRHWLHQKYDGSSYGAPDRDADQWVDPWGEIAEPPAILHRLVRLAERLAPTPDDREALIRTISEAESATDDEGAWALPEDVADALIAAGWHR